ncbi:hypothetical protein B0920_02665 [Massilia sp. KIM]|uniref:hypothetical protein n=1 Tax=Massilia sp. KIM TaxID=1955422 RepID=UPI0009902468|nr:hypothetical protein [Massilia sp. KIM]OON62388.1 hypothetical protein B0920_02665 [Massilia sp. KIM]
MRKTLLATQLALALLATAPAAWASAAQPTASLLERAGAPAPDVVQHFVDAGMREVRPHELDAGERRQVEAALAALPELHRRVLEKRLRRLGFVDGIPGAGTGLTSAVEGSGQFDITLRASILKESLGQFLSTKEKRLFADDGSGHSVSIEASGMDALGYVLLHEASHVVDMALGITEDRQAPLVRGIWAGGRELAPALAASPAAATPFRRAPALPAARARAVYDALADTPFVSLYATAAAGEDFAELVSWHEIARRHGGKLAILIRDAKGATVARYAPLDFPAVRARWPEVERLLRVQDGDGIR